MSEGESTLQVAFPLATNLKTYKKSATSFSEIVRASKNVKQFQSKADTGYTMHRALVFEKVMDGRTDTPCDKDALVHLKMLLLMSLLAELLVLMLAL